MNLRNKIVPKSDFQYSVNIDYDINSEEKIKGYIPTIGGLNIIEDVMLSTVPNSKDRARLFVGAYGKGKSHLVLTILSLLSKKDKKLFTSVLDKAKEFKKEFYDFLLEYINSDKKLLPVVIQGSSADTTQTLLLSLKNALVNNGLEKILPDSYFSSAVETIKNWKIQYAATYCNFVSAINEPIEEFIAKLNMYDNDTYQKFISIYPTLTSGSEFAPTKGLDVVKVYEDVAKKIRKYGYNGVFVVYDEFSKFLENSIGKTSAMEIKMIQDFAELCNRSGDNQLHLLLISHKHIQNYITQLPKEKVDAWKAVSERFKTIEIHNNFTQTYEIISTVIQKKADWFGKYKEEHTDDFALLRESADKLNVFYGLPEKVSKDLVYRTYPLDSSSLYILPRISELVAQNERTIFTFLASNQKNSLTDFINNVDEDFPLITPDYIYDYFEQLFRNENYNGDTFKVWSNCSRALAKLERETSNPLTYKLLKCAALITILQQQDNKFTPTIDTLTKIYLAKEKSVDKINAAFKELRQFGVISLRDYNNYISINKSTNVDLQKNIEDMMTRYKSSFVPKDELNELVSNRYLYPSRYNDEKAITRYFKTEFITDDEIVEVDDWNKKIENINADGIVYLILENKNIGRTALKDKIMSVSNSRIVFVRLKEQENVAKSLLKIKAIDSIYESAKDEEKLIIKEELSVYYEDCIKIINEFVDSYLRPELQKAIYFNCGVELKKIKRKSSVSQLLSDICEQVFTKTPIINNELINKNNISTPLFNARNKVLSALLQNEIKPNLGLLGSGPEINVMRSTLFAFGILKENSTKLDITNIADHNVQDIIDTIKTFFISSGEKAKNFAELYSKLTLPENGFGLKLGVIPVYIAVVLNLYKQHAVILNTSGKEIEIKAETLENINKTPRSYCLLLEDWNETKQDYITYLDQLFEKQVSSSEREYNSFDYIVKAMQRWFLQLPKLVKESKSIYKGNGEFVDIDSSTKKLRNQLRNSDLNSRELLFEKIPSIYSEKIGTTLFKKIKKSKELLDNMFDDTCACLVDDINKIFKGRANATMVSTLKDWVDELKSETKSYLLDNRNEAIFEYVQNASNSEEELLFKLTKHLSGLRLTDWEESTITYFIEALTNFKKQVDEKNASDSSSAVGEKGVYHISFVDENGNEDVKTLTKIETSRKAQLLDNDITSLLEDFGQSITTNEKRQVLLEIIRRLK